MDWDDDRVPHSEVRKTQWATASGRLVPIGDMEDVHLLNAYKRSGDRELFAEMVVRLFEKRVLP